MILLSVITIYLSGLESIVEFGLLFVPCFVADRIESKEVDEVTLNEKIGGTIFK